MFMELHSLMDVARAAWWSHMGEPYRWGGDDPLAGVDCSGLAIEGLKACGLFPRDADMRAVDLAKKYPATELVLPNCLIFWGNPIYHVEIVWTIIGNTIITLGASGGGSKTLTLEDAIKQNAYVKLRPARTGWVTVVDPFHELRIA